MSSQRRLATGVAERLWALGSLAVGATIPWAIWSSARESGSLVGGAVVAVPLTVLALAACDHGFGARVATLTRGAMALTSGHAPRDVASSLHGGLVADLASAALLLAVAAWLTAKGMRDARPSTLLAGLSSAALAAVFIGSAWLRSRVQRLARASRGTDEQPNDADKQDRVAGAIALFASTVVVTLSTSAAFASPDAAHFVGRPRPLFRGEWASGCVGASAPCEGSKQLVIDAEQAPVTVEAVLDRGVTLSLQGPPPRRLPMSLVAGTEKTYVVSLSDDTRAPRRLVVQGAGGYIIRYTRAR